MSKSTCRNMHNKAITFPKGGGGITVKNKVINVLSIRKSFQLSPPLKFHLSHRSVKVDV